MVIRLVGRGPVPGDERRSLSYRPPAPGHAATAAARAWVSEVVIFHSTPDTQGPFDGELGDATTNRVGYCGPAQAGSFVEDRLLLVDHPPTRLLVRGLAHLGAGASEDEFDRLVQRPLFAVGEPGLVGWAQHHQAFQGLAENVVLPDLGFSGLDKSGPDRLQLARRRASARASGTRPP
jgi:hypothetical protein